MTPNSAKIPYLPEPLQGLGDIALNFSWKWNRYARALFWEIDPTLYQLSGRNPIEVLRRVDPARLATLARDPEFLERYRKVQHEATVEDSAQGLCADRNGHWATGIDNLHASHHAFRTSKRDCADTTATEVLLNFADQVDRYTFVF